MKIIYFLNVIILNNSIVLFETSLLAKSAVHVLRKEEQKLILFQLYRYNNLPNLERVCLIDRSRVHDEFCKFRVFFLNCIIYIASAV